MTHRNTLILTIVMTAAIAPALSDTRKGEPTFADSWILLKLDEPLVARKADGSFSTTTGRQTIDRTLKATRATRIERAFPNANRLTRFADRRARHGLDRTYKVFVPAGSDIHAVVHSFEELPGVTYAEPDYIGTGGGTRVPDDVLFGSQYGFQQSSDADVDGPEAWTLETGKPIVIAILDSGIDSDHPDLAGKLVAGYDFVNDDDDPEDDHGHGTNVASIAAAESDNGIGVAGACWNCRIMPLKVLNASNSGFYSDWADAMVWATDRGVRVLNLSAGGNSSSSALIDGVIYAYNAGVTHISLTHNFDTGSVTFPGRYSQTITLGATEANDLRASPFCYSSTSGSNWGPQIDVVAPGELILGAAVGGGYNYWCGTSQAAPLAAGLVGLMQSINPSIGREETRHLLRSAAEDQVGRLDEDVPGFDPYHGWGRVNMDRTLRGTRASISLHVEDRTDTRVFHTLRNPLATTWDFVRGDLGSPTETVSGVDLGEVRCLAMNSPDANNGGNGDADIPAPSEGFFYVARFHGTPGAGSFGASSSNRDRTIRGCGL